MKEAEVRQKLAYRKEYASTEIGPAIGGRAFGTSIRTRGLFHRVRRSRILRVLGVGLRGFEPPTAGTQIAENQLFGGCHSASARRPRGLLLPFIVHSVQREGGLQRVVLSRSCCSPSRIRLCTPSLHHTLLPRDLRRP